ncbi:MAG: GMC oxidoreductase [Deltaproteobacteria bacterium]|nr:GMC oxidoreductase [Deltaproteobacteria bacterium]
MAERFDAVVVGSGFGGSVLACRLAAAGRSVLVLERGRRWPVAEYPSVSQANWIYDPDEPEKQNGWIDMRFFRRMAVVQGAGVGGGSLVYANVFIEAEPNAFDGGWPPEITYDRLKPHYDMAGSMLATQEIPDEQLTERFKLVREGAQAVGHGARFRKLDLAVSFDPTWTYAQEDPHNPAKSKSFRNAEGMTQGTCIHCGNCDIGCPVRAKNTLDLNYLAKATANGAEIRSLHTVRRLVPVDGGYRVDFERIVDGGRQPGFVTSAKVFIAAGSLGSTELLLRCRDEHGTLPNLSPRLGYGWCSNGDFLTPSVYSGREVSPTRGPTITGAISFLDGTVGGERFFVQDGGFPDLLGNALEHVASRNWMFHRVVSRIARTLTRLARDRDPATAIMPWFGQAVDQPVGQLKLRRRWLARDGFALKLRWDPKPSKAAVQALVEMHRKLSIQTGGIPLVPFTWTWMNYLVTPHPLGGCNMAASQDAGVVDHRGRVFGYDGLYVVDGAIIPRAIGLNPSRTITAVAEYIAELDLAA